MPSFLKDPVWDRELTDATIEQCHDLGIGDLDEFVASLMQNLAATVRC